MKKFMLFAVLLGVSIFVLTSCEGKKEEAPLAEVVEEEVVGDNGNGEGSNESVEAPAESEAQ
ncbi:MAG: hypothetical protein LBD17_03385 [Endomicrobium sp.]|jgi:hypothetical protein|nr:hypothetical protein [Endomicrobium sp.]